jgi:3-oxoacyl-[acyl-carrier-protein] synthase III
MIKISKIFFKLGKVIENNNVIEKKFRLRKNSLLKLTGIKKRYISNNKQTSESLALDVCKKLNKKQITSLTHVISVTNTPSIKFPGISNYISSFLKIENIHCINLNSGCSGFIDALILSYEMIKNDKKSKILIVTSDTYSKFINHKNKSIRPLFSDGASLTFIEYDKKGFKLVKKITKNIINTQSDLVFNGNEIKMNGPAVVSFTIKHVIPEIIKYSKNVENIYIHQAGKIVTNLIKSNFKDKKIIPTNFEKYGNLVSTSIPVLLKENFLKLKKNKTIIMCGFGVGLSMGMVKLVK